MKVYLEIANHWGKMALRAADLTLTPENVQKTECKTGANKRKTTANKRKTAANPKRVTNEFYTWAGFWLASVALEGF